MPKRSMEFKQAVRGYHIGGCVTGEPLAPDVDAHAHTNGTTPRWALGYICARSLRALREALLEEIAHLAVNDDFKHPNSDGHTAAWRNEMRRLGAPIPPHGRRK